MKDSIDESLTLVNKIKLIAWYEVYGLYDCAMETIKNSYDALNQLIPVDEICKSLISFSDER